MEGMKVFRQSMEPSAPIAVQDRLPPSQAGRPFCAGDSRSREVAGAPSVSAGREVHFGPRTLIFLEGDDAESVFRVVDGLVMLYKLLPDGRRQVVELLGKGDVFGFSRFPVRDCSAETLMATHCVVYDRSYVERSPALAREWNARLYAQLCALHEHVMLLGRKSAMERMASFLLRCVPGRGEPDCPGPQKTEDRAFIRLTMTRQEIGDFLGLTIETVSRLLGRLKRRGVVSLGKLDEIHAHDVCRLCRLTGTQLPRGEWCSAHARGRGLVHRSSPQG
jgi:CRP-like cAMP-binding protein